MSTWNNQAQSSSSTWSNNSQNTATWSNTAKGNGTTSIVYDYAVVYDSSLYAYDGYLSLLWDNQTKN